MYHASEADGPQCSEFPSPLVDLVLLIGDEIARQRFIRSVPFGDMHVLHSLVVSFSIQDMNSKIPKKIVIAICMHTLASPVQSPPPSSTTCGEKIKLGAGQRTQLNDPLLHVVLYLLRSRSGEKVTRLANPLTQVFLKQFPEQSSVPTG